MTKKYADSKADMREDERNAKKRGESVKKYKASAADRKADAAGQPRLDKKGVKRK